MNGISNSRKLVQKAGTFSSVSDKFLRKRKHGKDNKTLQQKYKHNKQTKIRKARMQNFINEKVNKTNYIEVLYDKFVVSNPTRLSRKDSSDSVVYVGTTCKSNLENVPLVDLTNSSENLETLEQYTDSKQLNTNFFPKGNFDRYLKSRKSLINLPIIKKIEPKKSYSTSAIEYKQKLSVLKIPPQFLSCEDTSYDFDVSKIIELTESDHEAIQWILYQENENMDLDVTFMPSSSEQNYFLNTHLSLEAILKVYDVSSSDSI